jgi:hypothetical protein
MSGQRAGLPSGQAVAGALGFDPLPDDALWGNLPLSWSTSSAVVLRAARSRMARAWERENKARAERVGVEQEIIRYEAERLRPRTYRKIEEALALKSGG